MTAATSVEDHYGRGGLGGAILEGLRASGAQMDDLGVDDLAPVDHFHTRGKAATVELLQRASVDAAARVLDLGGGLDPVGLQGGARLRLLFTRAEISPFVGAQASYRTGGQLIERDGTLVGEVEPGPLVGALAGVDVATRKGGTALLGIGYTWPIGTRTTISPAATGFQRGWLGLTERGIALQLAVGQSF